MKKKNKEIILELLCIFIMTIIYNLVFNEMIDDEVYNYGFAHNIAFGLIPYKDFNMIIPPLFAYMGGLFLVIFGKNIVIYHIYNSIICTILFYYIKKSTPKAYYILYGIMLYYSLLMPHYNLMCLLLMYILIDLEKKESNDYLIGFILGISFLTKQSIGFCLCISTFFTKDIRKIIKRIIGFMVPITILLFYLIYSKILYSFIDYCFLGLIEFGEKNSKNDPLFISIAVISILYLLREYFKKYDKNILYLIAIFSMSYPIFDSYHVLIPFIPTIGLLLNKLKLNKRIISYAFIFFLLLISSYNIYQYSTEKYSYPNSTNAYKYRKINYNAETHINSLSNYLKKSNDRVFIIDKYAYLIKLNENIPITKYDLLNNGNFGKDGPHKIINDFEEICNKEECTFLLYKYATIKIDYSQYNQEIYSYIINNYNETDKILGLSIYKNY